jgi:hypothetical protein
MATSVASGSSLPEGGVLRTGADIDADSLIEQSRDLSVKRLGNRDLLASLLLGSTFLVSALALAVLVDSTRATSIWTLAVFVGSYAVASRIDFEVGTGYAVPTELVLIPMLALLPVQYVPLCVLAGLLLGVCPSTRAGVCRSTAACCGS